MKKIMSTIATVVLVGSVGAAEVSVSQVRDFGVSGNGIRASAPLASVELTGTHIGDQYNRIGVGKSFDLVSVGPVKLSASAGVAHQWTLAPAAANGYGATLGVKGEYALGKNTSAVVGVEQFYGQSRISSFSGVTGTAGLQFRF